MQQAGIVEPSTSLYNFPICVIKKSDQTFQVILDLSRLNAIVKPIYNVLPRIQGLLEKISAWKLTCYSSLDMKSAYNSVPLSKNSSQYVSFSTIKGHYQMLRLPQGLSQSPTVFQR